VSCIIFILVTKCLICCGGTYFVISKIIIINLKNNRIMLIFKNDPFFNLMDTLFDVSTTKVVNKGFVQYNVSEDESQYKVEFVVPSLSKEDISILLGDDLLKVKYEKPEESTNGYISSFEKTFTLPEDINDKKIDAKVENGILTIDIPRVKKKSNQRQISIM
jgi:HSP20 family protein